MNDTIEKARNMMYILIWFNLSDIDCIGLKKGVTSPYKTKRYFENHIF